MTIEELKVVLSADDTNLKSGLKSAKREIKSVVSQSEDLKHIFDGLDTKQIKHMFDGLDTQQVKDALKQTQKEIKALETQSQKARKEVDKIFSNKQKGLSKGIEKTTNEIETLQSKINELVNKEIKIEAQSMQEIMKQNGFSEQQIKDSMITIPIGYKQVADGITLTDAQAEEWETTRQQIEKYEDELSDAQQYLDQLADKQDALANSVKDTNAELERMTNEFQRQNELRKEAAESYFDNEKQQWANPQPYEFTPYQPNPNAWGWQPPPDSTQQIAGQIDLLKDETSEYDKQISKLKEKEGELQKEIDAQKTMIADGKERIKQLEEQAAETKKQASEAKQLSSQFRSMLKDMSKQHGILKRISRLVRTLLIVRVLRSIISAVTKDIRECYNALILFDKKMGGIYGYNKTISDLSSGFKQISASIAVSAASLLSALAPALLDIINKIKVALDLFNQFIAAVSGKSTYMSVKTDFWQDYAAGIDTAKESAEDLKKTVMGFDEINKLSGQGAAGGGTSGGLSFNPEDMYEEKEIGDKAKALAEKFNELKEKLTPIFKFITEHIKEIGIALLALLGIKFAAKIVGQFLTIYDIVKKAVGVIKGIGIAIEGALGGSIGTFGLIVAAIAAVVAGFITMYKTSDEFKARVDKLWNETLKPSLEALWETAQRLWESIKTILKQVWDIVENLWMNVLAPILGEIGIVVMSLLPIITDTINAILKVLEPIFEVIGSVLDALQGVIDFVVGMFTGDIELALEGLKNFFVGIWNAIVGVLKTFCVALEAACEFIATLVSNVFKTIANFGISLYNILVNEVQNLINFVIKGLNKFLQGVTKVVNKVGDVIGSAKLSSINLQINPVDLSRIKANYLAEGGIVTHQTLAVLGENNKKEAVLPLDRNTEWVDMLASKLNNNSGDKNIKAELTVDGQTFGWLSINGINNITNQTGRLQLNLV